MELERVGVDRSRVDVARTTDETLHVNAVKRNNAVPEDGKGSGSGDTVQDMDRIVDELKKKFKRLMELFKSEAEFSFDKDIDKIVVKIKDRDTGEIIRQIPPEVAIKIAKSINELMGLLFDEKG